MHPQDERDPTTPSSTEPTDAQSDPLPEAGMAIGGAAAGAVAGGATLGPTGAAAGAAVGAVAGAAVGNVIPGETEDPESEEAPWVAPSAVESADPTTAVIATTVDSTHEHTRDQEGRCTCGAQV